MPNPTKQETLVSDEYTLRIADFEETKEFVKHKSIKDATKRLIGL